MIFIFEPPLKLFGSLGKCASHFENLIQAQFEQNQYINYMIFNSLYKRSMTMNFIE